MTDKPTPLSTGAPPRDAGLRAELRVILMTAWKWGWATGRTTCGTEVMHSERAGDIKELMLDVDVLLAAHGIAPSEPKA